MLDFVGIQLARRATEGQFRNDHRTPPAERGRKSRIHLRVPTLLRMSRSTRERRPARVVGGSDA